MRAAAGLPLLGAAGALLTASFAGLLPTPVPGAAGLWTLGLLIGFVAWNGVTIWWSVQADRSWDYANRGLVYVALCVLGLYVGAFVPRPAQLVAGGLCLLFGAVLVWALAGKVVPALFPDGERVARLRNPIGYWNGLALVCDMALPLFLWLAARRRDLASLGVYLAAIALLLTYSRGGLLVAAAMVALWLGIGLALPGVADDLQPSSVRVRDGAWFGLALVLGAVVVALLARRELRRVDLRRFAALTAVLV